MSNYADNINALSPVAYWRLGESSGTTTAADETSIYNGTYIGTPTLEEPGLLINDSNTSVTFNGTSQNVNLSASLIAELQTHSTGSICFLAKLATGNRCGLFFADSASNNEDFVIDFTETRIAFTFKYNGAAEGVDNFVLAALGTFNINTPYHIVIVQDDTDSAYIYVNGTKQTTTANFGTPSNRWFANALNVNTANLNLYDRDASIYYAGTLDEVAIFDTALTAKNILDLYHSAQNYYYEDTYSEYVNRLLPVGYWRLGEDNANTGTTFDPNHLGTSSTLSNSNRTIKHTDPTNIFSGSVSIGTINEGEEKYIEVTKNTNQQYNYIGFYPNNTTVMGTLNNGICLKYNYNYPQLWIEGSNYDNVGPDMLANHTYGMTLNYDTGRLRIHDNGVLIEDLDLKANYGLSDLTGDWYAVVSTYHTNNSLTIRLEENYYVYPIPTGATAFAKVETYIAVDETGTQNGTYIGSPTSAAPSLLVNDADYSVDFAGLTENIDIPHNAAFSSDSQSISCLFEAPSSIPADSKGLMYKAPTTGFDREFGLTVSSVTGFIGFAVYDGTSLSETVFGTTNICDGQIHHVVAVKKYALNNDELLLYIDGVFDAALEIGYNGVQNTNEVVIGKVASNSIAARFYIGRMDEAIIFDTVLNPAQITELHRIATNIIAIFNKVTNLIIPKAFTFFNSKSLTLTIDHTKVDDDLYNFPFLVNLGVTSGINSTDSTVIMEVLDIGSTENLGFNLETSSSDVYDYTNDDKTINPNSGGWRTAFAEQTIGPGYKGYIEYVVDIDGALACGFCSSDSVNNTLINALEGGFGLYQNSGVTYLRIGSTNYSATVPRFYSGNVVQMEFDYDNMILKFFKLGVLYDTYDLVNTYGMTPYTGIAYTGASPYAITSMTLRVTNAEFTSEPAGINAWADYTVNQNKKLSTIYPSTNFNKPASVDDDFTGTDGDAPNTILWDSIGKPSIIDNNKLLQVEDASVSTLIKALYYLTGDFDVQIEYDSTGSTLDVSTGYGYIGFYNDIGDKVEFWFITRTSEIKIEIRVNSSIIASLFDSDFTIGSMRIIRVGTLYTCQYKNLGTLVWTTIISTASFSEDAKVHINTKSVESLPYMEIRWDNFIVNSGTIVWPTYDDIADKTSQECKVEIDRWDQANLQAQLWVKLPYVSKDEDTIITLNYDPNNADNSANIDYTGTTPAKAVWEEYDAVYHLSKDGADSAASSLDGTLVNINGYNVVDFGIGKGLTFNGTDEWIDIGLQDTFDLLVTDNMTVEGTAEVSDDTAIGRLLQNRGTGTPINTGFYNRLSASGAFQNYMSTDSNVSITKNEIGTIYTQDIALTTAMVFTQATGGLETFKDGISFDDVINVAGTPENSAYDSTKNVTIGCAWDDAVTQSQFMHGKLKEVRFSKSLKTPDWIASNYESTQDTLAIFTNEPIPYSVIVVMNKVVELMAPNTYAQLVAASQNISVNLMLGNIASYIVQQVFSKATDLFTSNNNEVAIASNPNINSTLFTGKPSTTKVTTFQIKLLDAIVANKFIYGYAVKFNKVSTYFATYSATFVKVAGININSTNITANNSGFVVTSAIKLNTTSPVTNSFVAAMVATIRSVTEPFVTFKFTQTNISQIEIASVPIEANAVSAATLTAVNKATITTITYPSTFTNLAIQKLASDLITALDFTLRAGGTREVIDITCFINKNKSTIQFINKNKVQDSYIAKAFNPSLDITSVFNSDNAIMTTVEIDTEL